MIRMSMLSLLGISPKLIFFKVSARVVAGRKMSREAVVNNLFIENGFLSLKPPVYEKVTTEE